MSQRVAALVDLHAICANVRAVKERVGKDCTVMAVVKANAYGHGAVPVSLALQNDGISHFAVATAEEGALLRQNGIVGTILALGYSFPEEFAELLQYDITQTIFEADSAMLLAEAAQKAGKVAHIHIKVDTGMNRIGLTPDENGLEIVRRIAAIPHLQIDGAFTHFSCADTEDGSVTQQQLRRFREFTDAVIAAGIPLPVRHVCNSAAILNLDAADYGNMVRCGIMTYGLYPSDEVKHVLPLTPAMELKSHISYIKTVPAGTPISYGGTYVTPSERRIATIPVGYGDGYPRSLSSKGRVLINGQFAPIVGRVCMDQFMVDVTEIDASQGDPVTLIGSDGDCVITMEEVAALSGRFHYEIPCLLTPRMQRVYR